jgi:hypothetical protein
MIFSKILSTIPYSTTATVLSSVAIVCLVWEHIGRKRQTKIRPSVGLTIVAQKSQNAFQYLGEKSALISSYLTQIDLKDIGVTLCDISKPTFDLITSPFYIIYGYVKIANSYANKTWLVYIGSGLLVVLLPTGCYYLSKYYPSLNFLGGFFHMLPTSKLVGNIN